MSRTFKATFSALAVALILATVPSAHASLTFALGNNPQPDEQTIQYVQGQTGMTVIGFTNQTNTLVDFTSPQTLNTPTSGAARLIALSGPGGSQIALTDVTTSVPGGTFLDLIFNPMLNQGTGPGTGGAATVTVNGLTATNTPESMVFSYPSPVGNGNNFATVTATDGERITSVALSVPGGFTAFDQPRISGLSAVPEPATLTMLGTSAVVGIVFGWWRRRCHQVVV